MTMLLFANNSNITPQHKQGIVEPGGGLSLDGSHHVAHQVDDSQVSAIKEANEKKETTPVRRHVRFSEDNNGNIEREIVMMEDVPPSSDMTVEEKQELYHSKTEFGHARLEARLHARKAREQDMQNGLPQQCYTLALLRMYNDCVNEGDSDDEDHYAPFYTPTSDSSSDSSSNSIASMEHVQCLKKWTTTTSDDVCRRGLERYIVPELTLVRRNDKNMVVRNVLQAQRRLKKAKHAHWDDCNNKADYLAMVSQRYSKPAKVFAQQMAHVDEFAAAHQTRTATAPTR